MAQRVFPVDAVSGAPAYSGRAIRQSLLAPLLAGATATRPLGAISGVRPGTPDTTVTATSTVWTVKPHAGVLDVETAAEAGPYGYAIDANVTGSVTAAHATYTRWDGIYVQLSDPAESDGTATPGVAVVYVAGTPAASPAMPAQPTRSMLLARIVVPKSGSGSPSVVWLAPVLAVAGGVRHYNSVGELPAGLGLTDSGTVAVIGSGADYAEYVYTGSVWRPAGVHTRGKANLGITSDVVVPTAPAAMATINPTMLAGAAVVRCTGTVANGISGATRGATISVRRDGIVLGLPDYYSLPHVAGQAVGQSFSYAFDVASETAGAHTYALWASTDTASTVVLRNVRIWVEQGDPGLA